MQRLIFIRHGMTSWNNLFRYQGHTDIKLNEEGIAQAEAARSKVAQYQLQAIYSSDLSRAVETAKIIAVPHNLPVRACRELREINFGVWEGLTYQDLEQKYPQLLKTWLEAPHLLAVPCGETFLEVQQRALSGVCEILARHKTGNIAVVSHGGTIAALICGLLNEPIAEMWQYKQKNASLTTFLVEKKKFILETVNDISHLAVNE